jgi:hypothetical protein
VALALVLIAALLIAVVSVLVTINVVFLVLTHANQWITLVRVHFQNLAKTVAFLPIVVIAAWRQHRQVALKVAAATQPLLDKVLGQNLRLKNARTVNSY